MSNDLEILKQHHEALLLAEVAAWLHDDFKHTDAHIHSYVTGAPVPSGRQDTGDLIPARQVTVLGVTLPLSDVKNRRRADFIAGYLNRCHYTAHIEKQKWDAPQSYPAFLSSPFGSESNRTKVPPNLTTDLRSKLSWLLLANLSFTTRDHATLRQEISALFSRVGGDTRRPANEITLWEWSHTVGALYKVALSGALLGFQPQANDLRWRLLSVRFDGLSFLASASRLPDLLAREAVLDDALNRVRQLLEEEYPLGTEVFRDENGSVFVVPGCEKTNCGLDILALLDGRGVSLADLLRCAVRGDQRLDLQGEMTPVIQLDPTPWWGQDPRQARNDEIPLVGEHLKDVTSPADPQWAIDRWQSATTDICPVCGLRPQADPRSNNKDERKAGERKVCLICEQRRADRAKEWTRNLGMTIWTDEVADDKGRLALVVGQFDLERWLDGTLVQTLTVTDPAQDSTPNKANVARKNPSFARIRRVWETTRAFWQEIGAEFPGSVGSGSSRLEIRPEEAEKLDLGLFHTVELLVQGVRLSVVWDSDNKRFITCDNLAYLAKPEQLGAQVADLVKPGRSFPLEEPAGYGGANRRLGTITVAQVASLPEAYTPAIPILAEPRTFMALVPADKALAVVNDIKAKYEQEMGKVRNRLPLTLGVVYAGRRTPLTVILDAGRRMLRRPSQTAQADVVGTTPQNPLPDGWPRKLDVKLRLGEREIVVAVPTVMGDGTTHDVWYPYWQAAGKPTDRNRWFVGPDGEHWVHVCDLRPGDTVAFTPSTFDFEYLDVSSRRFEAAYGDDGQRMGADKRQRPYLLEQLADLEAAWEQIRRLPASQIKKVEASIEAKRRDWGEATGTSAVSLTFQQFVGDVLREAKVYTPALAPAAITGLLADALEIHLTIHKDKPQPEEV